ncbi:MAG: D-aminoacyl-tRNA deacylase [Gammaproteobacteria bacterium]
MIGLLQRVKGASVSIGNKKVAEIDSGLLVLVGIEQQDSQQHAQRLFEKLIRYRVFPDSSGKMNLSLTDIAGGLLLVPQFTLVADTRKGLRPGFSNGASPEQGKQLFEYLVDHARQNYNNTESGVFGADMQVSLVNDGPVTFWLQV